MSLVLKGTPDFSDDGLQNHVFIRSIPLVNSTNCSVENLWNVC